MVDQARAVVIGGGIVGTSVAYHLTQLGWRDVVLLEQGGLSGGTTWHAAGLVGQLRSSSNLTRLIRYSVDLYSRLEAETGQSTGWKRCGSVSVARTAERMVQLKRNAALAMAYDIEAHVIDVAEAARRYPAMRTEDLVGAVWIPGDGKANPADITQALARGARARGARLLEGVAVTGVNIVRGAVAGVETSNGPIATEIVVNCAGMWARELGRLSGVTIPLRACEHMYIVTQPIAGIAPDLPVLRDPDGHIYVKEEVGGLLMGGFDPWAKPWGTERIPDGFSFQTLKEDWGKFEILMTNALERLPALETAEVRTFLNGPESFTPDNYFIMGEAPEVLVDNCTVQIETGDQVTMDMDEDHAVTASGARTVMLARSLATRAPGGTAREAAADGGGRAVGATPRWLDRRHLIIAYAAFAGYAAIDAGLSAGRDQIWAIWAACGYVAALVILWRWGSRTVAVLVSVALAVLAPLLWLSVAYPLEDGMRVIDRSAALLLHHGSPYLTAGQVTNWLSYNPYLPVMTLFGLPAAAGLGGLAGNPGVWLALGTVAVLAAAFWIALPPGPDDAPAPDGAPRPTERPGRTERPRPSARGRPAGRGAAMRCWPRRSRSPRP